jgi:hypothetical protein
MQYSPCKSLLVCDHSWHVTGASRDRILACILYVWASMHPFMHRCVHVAELLRALVRTPACCHSTMCWHTSWCNTKHSGS